MAKATRVVTPIVELTFPYIDLPDTKFGGANYGTGFRLPRDHDIIKQIDGFIEDNFTKGEMKHPKFSRGYRADAENPGLVTLKASSKSAQQVADVRARAIAPPAIGGGSKARVSIAIDKSKSDSFPGVVIRYNGLQLVTLVERGGMFGDLSDQIEDGYEADDEQVAQGRELAKAARQNQGKTDGVIPVETAADAGSTDF